MNINQQKTTVLLESLLNVIEYQPTHIQRLLNETHVLNLVDDQIEEFAKWGQFSVLQSITCADFNNKRYVLDGQHRIAAFKMLKNLHYSLNQFIPLVVYKVNSIDELKHYYVRINKHHPINPLETTEDWFKFGKQFCVWLKTEYHPYIKNTDKTCNCPHINLREMIEYMRRMNVFERMSTVTVDNESLDAIYKTIRDINAYMVEHYDTMKRLQFISDFKKKIEKCYDKNPTKPCFLGVWRQFEWIEMSLYLIKHKKHVSQIELSLFNCDRMKIPKMLRNQVWMKRNGNIMEGKCFVCDAILQFENMECGHVIPHVYNGTLTLDNLEPICKTCNRDMGIMNMNEYKSILHINDGNTN